MKKFENVLNHINTIYIIGILSYIFFGSVLILYDKLSLEQYSNLFYIINIGTLFLWILNHFLHKKTKLVDLLILLLIFFGLLSTVLSKYQEKSLWGQSGRCEGLLMLVSYYLLYLLSTYVKDKKKIVITILGFGILQVLVGILQQFDLMPMIDDGTKYSGGLVGNSNYFSTQNLMWLSLSLGMFVFGKKWYSILLIVLFSIGLSLGGAMSCFVGLICVFMSIPFCIFYQKNIDKKTLFKKYGISIFIVFFVFLFVGVLTNNGIGNDIKNLFLQANDIVVNQNTDDTYGTFRLYIWKNTLPKVKDYMWYGVGIDCYRYIFNPYLRIDGKIVGKAHNEYLQILITEGIFALMTYLLLLFVCCFQNIKRMKKDFSSLEYAIILSVIGYITQAFFNISVVRVAPIYFILLGLSYRRDVE